MLFGWPAVAASVLLSAVGIILRRTLVVFIGAALALAFLLHLAGTPRYALTAPVVAVLYLATVYAVARLRRWVAWLLWMVFLLFCAWIALAVATG